MNIKFAVCADLHSEYIPDSVERINTFLKSALEYQVDFCVQLGDFCPPGDLNCVHKKQILETINKIPIPFYHTLGNHDMDRNNKRAVLDNYGIARSYYSFDMGSVHFVVLDGCNCLKQDTCYDYDKGNYRSLVPDEISVLDEAQLDWLSADLETAKYPAVLFSHQSLVESRASIANAPKLRKIIENTPNGVLAAFCGHEHVDRAEQINGIWYYCVNSMSYYWAGSKYDHDTYGKQIEQNHPLIRKVFPYKHPVFAIVEITDDSIIINGTKSEFVGKSPAQLDFVKSNLCDPITASIKNRTLAINKKSSV